jgi:hypothetical protein
MLQCFSLLFFTVVEFLIHCIETNEKEKKKKKASRRVNVLKLGERELDI